MPAGERAGISKQHICSSVSCWGDVCMHREGTALFPSQNYPLFFLLCAKSDNLIKAGLSWRLTNESACNNLDPICPWKAHRWVPDGLLCNKAYKRMLNSQGFYWDLSIYLIRLRAILSWDDLSVQEPEYNDMSKRSGEEMRDESCSLPFTSGHRLFAMNW